MIEIKNTTENDIDTIQQLANEIWPTAYNDILSPPQMQYMLDLFYSREALVSQMNISKHSFILVCYNSIPVGFASYAPKEGSGKQRFRLHKLYVSTAMQHKGFGKKMLEYIFENVRVHGAGILELNVNRYNKAVKFYSSLGFQITREEDVDIGQGYFMNDYVMEMHLH